MSTVSPGRRHVYRESLRRRRQRILLEYITDRRGSIIFEPDGRVYAQLADRGLTRGMVNRYLEDLEDDQLIRVTRGVDERLHVELTIDAKIRN